MHRPAFTLIELLVVITIIVLLLALLTPALDKAVYQAELALCGSNQRAIASTVTTYAMDFKRQYPYRPGVRNTAWRTTMIYDPNNKYDDRPILRPYMSINKVFQCPLTGEIDMDGSAAESRVYAPYIPWFGWQYKVQGKAQKGLFKLGDRLEWNGDTFDVLASDRDGIRPGVDTCTHPDHDEVLVNGYVTNGNGFVADGPAPTGTGVGVLHTISFWAGGNSRGTVDTNFARADLSVTRFDGVERTGDERMIAVPEHNTNQEEAWDAHLPAR